MLPLAEEAGELKDEGMEMPMKSQLGTVRANIIKSNADKLTVLLQDFILIPLLI